MLGIQGNVGLPRGGLGASHAIGDATVPSPPRAFIFVRKNGVQVLVVFLVCGAAQGKIWSVYQI